MRASTLKKLHRRVDPPSPLTAGSVDRRIRTLGLDPKRLIGATSRRGVSSHSPVERRDALRFDVARAMLEPAELVDVLPWKAGLQRALHDRSPVSEAGQQFGLLHAHDVDVC